MKPQSTGWRKITKRSPSKKDFPAIGGSYRGHRGASHWSMSSVFESRDDCGGWDSDRTHFFSIPKPPLK